jgi:dihydrofolate reductase
MRKLILQLAVSLDGFIEGPNGEYDWCFVDQDYGMAAFFQRVDSVFYGRKSYELTQSMAAEGGMPPFPKLKEYVFSNTLTDTPSGATLIGGDIDAEVRRIKSEPGKDIWLFGGASLTTSLMNGGHVDELSLAVHPIILGGGKPLFSELKDRVALTLLDTKVYETGLVMMSYAVRERNSSN